MRLNSSVVCAPFHLPYIIKSIEPSSYKKIDLLSLALNSLGFRIDPEILRRNYVERR